MLKKHKNTLHSVITDNGFVVTDFRFEENIRNNISTITIRYKDTKLTFVFETVDNSFDQFDILYFTRFAPNYPLAKSNEVWPNIATVSKILLSWLKIEVHEYIEEKNAPNLWEQMQGKYLLDIDPFSNTDNSKFSNTENKQVKEALNTFKRQAIEKYKPDSEQLELIEERIEYLIDASDRLGKTDWHGILISTMFSITIALSLDTEVGSELYAMFKQAFIASLDLLK